MNKEKAIIRTTEILSVTIDIMLYIAFTIVTAFIICASCFYFCLSSKAAEDVVALHTSAEGVYAGIEREDGYYYEAVYVDEFFKNEHYYNYCVLKFPKADGFMPVIFWHDGGPPYYAFRIYDKSIGDFTSDVGAIPLIEVIEPYHKEGIYNFPDLHRDYYVPNFYLADYDNRKDNVEMFGDMYIFSSEQSALNYCINGDKSGIIQQPNGDYSKRHDFSGDTYDADMPVPQLSHFSHNGFTVNNASDDLFLDIIVESKFYGVEHKETDILDELDVSLEKHQGYDINNSWIYGSHYYNLTERSHIAVNAPKIDIKELYGVDNEAALMSDFQKWTIDYPYHNKLPDYNFFKHQGAVWDALYGEHRVDLDSTIAKLTRNKQAATTYYVRFYNKDMKYSRWLAYTFRGTGSGVSCNPVVQTGVVVPDKDGNPTVPNPETGTQDPDGNISYGGTGTSTMDFSDLWATIKSLVVSMGEVPDLIGHVFSFLPQWILYMIAAGIAGIIALRFAGR